MKTALLIQNYPAAAERVKLLWSYYRRAGLDIFGVSTEDGECFWPEAIPAKKIGINAYIQAGHLSKKLADCFDWFLTDPLFQSYDSVCVIENDTIFLGPFPDHGYHVTARLAGGPVPPMKAGRFWHNPWYLTRDMAKRFVSGAKELLAQGENELGNPDFFFGFVCERYMLPVVDFPGCMSQNSFDNPHSVEVGRRAVKEGCWCIHGVKTKAQLDAIMS